MIRSILIGGALVWCVGVGALTGWIVYLATLDGLDRRHARKQGRRTVQLDEQDYNLLRKWELEYHREQGA